MPFLSVFKVHVLMSIHSGIDFDDQEYGFKEEDKPYIKVCFSYFQRSSTRSQK